MYKVEKLKKDDYDNLLEFLNISFDRLNERSFDRFLPAMWRRNDEIMQKNFGIKKDGKIIAVMGVYPLKANICGKEVLFATTGNVAVDPEYRNLGLMKQLMTFAAQELEAQNIDAARLGGERLRYNRYGYEFLGSTNSYILTAKNLKALSEIAEYTFKPISRNDIANLSFINELHNSKAFYIDRGNGDYTFDIMSAFYGSAYMVYNADGEPIGAVSVSDDKDRIHDVIAADAKTEFDILCAWLKNQGLSKLYFSSQPWNTDFNIIANSICEQTVVEYATQCKIRNWDTVCDAFIALKNSYSSNLCEDSFVIEIEGYGALEFSKKGCKKTDKMPDLSIDSLLATRLIFGMQSPENVCKLPADKAFAISSLFPLPFGWNTLDRV